MAHPRTSGPRRRSVLVHPVVLSLGVAVVLLLVFSYFSVRLAGYEREEARARVTQILAPYANGLTASVNTRFAMLAGLQEFVTVALPDGPDKARFNAFAAGLTARADGIRAVQVAPGGVFTLIYPAEGNTPPGRNLFEDQRPEVQADIQRAMDTGGIIISGPYELTQGGLGMVGRQVVRTPDGEFWGFVVIVLDLPPILEEAGLRSAPEGLRFAVRDNEGRVFVGDAGVLDESPVVFANSLPDGAWEIAAVPAEGWGNVSRGGQAALWAAGVVITLALSTLLYLLLTHRQRLADEVAAQTERLEEQAGLFQRVTETSPVGIVVVGVDGRIAMANAAAEGILGLERDVISLRTYDDPAWRVVDTTGGPFPPEGLPVARVLATGAPVFDVRHGIEWPDGQRRILSVNAAPLLDPSGEVAGVVASLLDITLHEQAEQTLRKQEYLLREIGRAAKVGGWEFDPATGAGTWTEETARIHDVDPTDETGVERGLGFYHGEDRVRIQQAIARAVEEGVGYDLELEMVSAAGARKWVHTIGHPVIEDGTVVKVRGSFQDITRRKQAEEQIRTLNRELESRVQRRTRDLEAVNRELEAFSYSVSHDLRAPLRAIDGFSQALLEDYDAALDDEGKDLLRRVRAAATRMAELIDDLLSLSRLSRRALDLSDVDLSDLASEVIRELSERQPERRVRTVVSPGAVARADRALVRVVLENLLGNAFKFTERTDKAVVEFGFENDEGAVWFFVRDNGAGFDVKYADKLFTAFQRLHSTEEFEGTGIGLAIVQRVVARHGGFVRCEGEPGRGAAFYFTLDRGKGGER